MPVNMGTLVLDLIANVGKLEKDMGKAVGILRRTHGEMGRYAKWIGVSIAGAFSVGALRDWFSKSTEAIAQYEELGKSLGMTAEQVSSFSWAAKEAGTPVEAFQQGVTRLTKNLLGAEGPTKATQAALKSLGLTGREATDAQGWLYVLADRFAKIPDGATKTAAALALFGKTGTAMIPMLNDGSETIKRFQEQARDLGLVVSAAQAEEAHQFTQELDKMRATVDALGMSLAGSAIPGLKLFFQTWNEQIRQGKDFEGLALGLGTAFSDRMAMEAEEGAKGQLDLALKQLMELRERIRRGMEQQSQGGLYGGLARFFGSDELKKAVEEQKNLMAQVRLFQQAYLLELAANEKKRQDIQRQGMDQRRASSKTILGDAELKQAQKDLDYYQKAFWNFCRNQVAAARQAAKERKEVWDWANKAELETRNEAVQRQLEEEKVAQEWRLRAVEQVTEKQRQAYEKMRDASRNYSREAAGAFWEMATTGKDAFSDMVNGMLADLGRLMIQRSFMNDLFGGLVGAIGGNKPVPSTSITATSTGSPTVYSGSATATPMARGGILTRPTLLAGGAALAGEAGAEGVLPLARTRSGDLGVRATGGGVTIQVYDQRGAGAPVEARSTRSVDGSQVVRLMIRDEVRAGLRDGTFDGDMRSRYGLRGEVARR